MHFWLSIACSSPEGDTLAPGPGVTDGATSDAEAEALFEEVLSFMQDEFDREAVVGGALAVVFEGRLAWSAGVGVREMDGNEPVTADTLFNIASATKQFTAATAMSLVDDGSLDLDSPVGAYVPYFGVASPYDPEAVTLRGLLSHTAAYPSSMVGKPDQSSYDLDDYFRNNPDQPLLVEPGEVWNYSNLGFSLASLAVQEAGGDDFPELVESRVLGPVGMTSATMRARKAKRREFTYGHCMEYCDGELYVLDPTFYDSQIYWGQGGLWASANDLGRWSEFLLHGDADVLSEQSRAEMLSPQAPTGSLPGSSYGLGLFVSDTFGPETVSHGGDNYGFRAQIILVPEEAFGVVVLVNSDWYYPGTIATHAASLFTTYEEPDWDALTPDPAELQALVGSYADEIWWGSFEVTFVGGELRGNFVEAGSEETIYPSIGNGLYVWDGDDWTYATAWYDEGGVPEYLVTRGGVAVRVD
ncbi:MAG: beta-lactamase family protein [Deltaproteobacteria bacterium]|nr:beta-lactamase family protein [Deltaproteobacteria bacterium]